MSGSKGRPKKKGAIQERNIGFFVTQAQFAVILRKIEQADVNISDYMRQAALTAEVRARWTAEEREMVRRLVGMSVDLNGLLTVAQEQGVAVAAELFAGCRNDMDEIIKKLCHDR